MTDSIHKEQKTYSADNRLELDTAATIFPLAFCEKQKSLIRLKVTMSEMVDKNILQRALERLMPRFPSFYVRLCHDQFNYFFEKLDEAPLICSEENVSDPLFMTLDDLSKCAFRIIVTENCLALEYSHALSDGYGGSIFLKSLIAEYLSIKYESFADYMGVLNVNETPKHEEIKDAYPEVAGASSKIKGIADSYSLKGEKDKKLHITELSFEVDELLACADEYGVSLTALLSGVLTEALLDLQQQEKTKQEIRLSVPVDLRRRFGSDTLRNFSLPVSVKAKKAKKRVHLLDLCQSFNEQLKANVGKENLAAIVKSYVQMAKSKILFALPLFLKKWLIRTFFSVYNGGNCMTFSNLGVWSIPDNMKPYVKQCSMMFTPKPTAPYSCGVVSIANTLTLTLTRSIKEPLLESRILQVFEKILLNKNIKEEVIA